MPEPRPDAPAEPSTDDRLQSWKEIAAYLNRDVRTVQRWERQFGLPVYRNPDQKRSAVHALRHELDVWLAETHVARENNGASPHARWDLRVAAAAGLVLVLVAAAVVLTRSGDGGTPVGLVAEQLDTFRFTSGLASPDGRWFAYRDVERAFLRIESLIGEQTDRLLVDQTVFADIVWSPDSTRLAYRVPAGTLVQVESVEVSRGTRRALATAAALDAPVLVGWSHGDPGLVAVVQQEGNESGRLVRIDTEDGSLRDLAYLPGDSRGWSLSPDGSFVAFTRPGVSRPAPDVYVHHLESTRTLRLTDDPRADYAPIWTPDSRHVVFVRGYNTDVDRSVLEIEIDDGGAPTSEEVDLGPSGDFHPHAGFSVSEAGDLFVGRRFEGFRVAILDVDPETGEPTGTPRTDFPEGSMIARWVTDDVVWYESFALAGEMPSQRLFIERQLSAGVERLVEAPGSAPADGFRETARVGLRWRYQRRPGSAVIQRRRSDEPEASFFLELDEPIAALTVSPDEATLAVMTFNATRQLYRASVIDVASRRVTPLAQTRLMSHPMWSPDGREITFVDGPCLLVASRDGSSVQELACAPRPSDLPIGNPAAIGLLPELLWMDLNLAAWSPDGSKLLFAVPVPTADRVELWMVDRGSGSHKTVYAGEPGYAVMPRGPAWSPSGARISFSIRTHPPSEIWVLRGRLGS